MQASTQFERLGGTPQRGPSLRELGPELGAAKPGLLWAQGHIGMARSKIVLLQNGQAQGVLIMTPARQVHAAHFEEFEGSCSPGHGGAAAQRGMCRCENWRTVCQPTFRMLPLCLPDRLAGEGLKLASNRDRSCFGIFPLGAGSGRLGNPSLGANSALITLPRTHMHAPIPSYSCGPSAGYLR